MRSVVEFLKTKTDKPWLIAGKGPSFELLTAKTQKRFHILTLGHALEGVAAPTLAAFADIEPLADCAPRLMQQRIPVVMPWHLHVGSKPSKKMLHEFVLVRILEQAGRVYSYNSSSTSLPKHPQLPVLTLSKFSATAAFDMLAAAGHKVIYSAGVDGGASYSARFKTDRLLNNGQRSFDVQFPVIQRILKRRGVQWERLR